MILPFIEEATLYNASNVLGYPGWAGPYAVAYASTAPNQKLYNMDWCNTTVRSTRLNAFVCPTDPKNIRKTISSSPVISRYSRRRASRILRTWRGEFRSPTGHAAIMERFKVIPTPTTRSMESTILVPNRWLRAMWA